MTSLAYVGPVLVERVRGHFVLVIAHVFVADPVYVILAVAGLCAAAAAAELARVDPRGVGCLACLLDEALDLGLELLAQEVLEDVLVGTAGEVGRGVDNEAAEEAGIVVDEFLDGVDSGAEDLSRVLQAFAVTGMLAK